MTEAPARVRAMLEGGVSDPGSPANALTDKRYANFVAAFNFVEDGAQTTSSDAVLKEVPKQYAAGTGLVLVQAERRLHQGRGRLLQGQHLEGEVDHRPAWPTSACCPSRWPPTGWTPSTETPTRIRTDA